jgi:hypothetical protein
VTIREIAGRQMMEQEAVAKRLDVLFAGKTGGLQIGERTFHLFARKP